MFQLFKDNVRFLNFKFFKKQLHFHVLDFVLKCSLVYIFFFSLHECSMHYALTATAELFFSNIGQAVGRVVIFPVADVLSKTLFFI